MELTPNLHAFLWTSLRANNCNTYLIRSPQKTVLIDPGHAAFFDHVHEGLDGLNLTIDDIDLIICTHAHPDHIEAIRLFEGTAVPFTLHSAEWELVQNMAAFMKSAAPIDLSQFSPEFFLTEGELAIGDITIDVYHTPGHSPGGVTLFWQPAGALFTGDLIFNNGLGRTDLPGGDGVKLKESIRRMASLKADWLLPGHGEVVSGAEAVSANFDQVEQVWFGYI
jgi:glyoxylase-like metal-dependent hydrolase (beta-lactamase superfamily II)